MGGVEPGLTVQQARSATDVWLRAWGVACARVVLGILMGMRGWDKVFNLTPVVHATRFFTVPYADTWIPQWLLWITGVTIPFVELMTGCLLVVGWRTREALVGLGLLLMLVTYGHMLANPLFNDIIVFTRLVLLVSVAMVPRDDDRFSIDYWISSRRRLRS